MQLVRRVGRDDRWAAQIITLRANTVTWGFPVTVILVAEAWENFGRAFCVRGECHCRPGDVQGVQGGTGLGPAVDGRCGQQCVPELRPLPAAEGGPASAVRRGEGCLPVTLVASHELRDAREPPACFVSFCALRVSALRFSSRQSRTCR
jgi:hypothetical protein